MAFRYSKMRYPGGAEQPLAYALANLGNAFLSGPSQFEVDKLGMETDKLKIERDKLGREFHSTGQLGDAVGALDYTPQTAADIRRLSVLSGRTGADMGNIGRTFTFQAAGADQPTRDRAFMAAGGPADNTETGHAQTLANRIQQANIGAGATIQAAHIGQAGQDRRMLGTYLVDGKPVAVPTAIAGRDRMTPVLPSSYYDKGEVPQPDGTVRQVFVLPGAPGDARPVIQAQSPAGKVERDVSTGIIPTDRVAPARDAIDNPNGIRTRDAKIADWVKNGMDPRRAAALVDGYIKIEKLEGGQIVEIDLTTGKRRALRPDDPAVLAQPPVTVGPAPSSADTQRALSDAVGPLPGLSRLIAKSPPAFLYNAFGGEGSFAPTTAANTNALDLVGRHLKEALQIGRAQKDLDQVAAMVPSGGWGSPADAMQSFTNIRRDLTKGIDMDQRRLESGMPLSVAARTQIEKDIRKRIDAISSMDDYVKRFGGNQADRPQTGTEPAAPAAAQPPLASRPDPEAIRAAYAKARKALQLGASRREVDQSLRDMGIDPKGLR